MITVIADGSNQITTRPKCEVLRLASQHSEKFHNVVIVNERTESKDESFSYKNGILMAYQDNKFMETVRCQLTPRK
jgi:hypothetical protein